MSAKNTPKLTIEKSIVQYVLGVRRQLHEHPETRWETEETRNFIATEVRRIDLNTAGHDGAVEISRIYFDSAMKEGGIIVDVKVPGATETVLFRADFDAMPVPEKTGLPFASKVEGKSHACGHDVGSAMLLGFLKAISTNEIKLTKNIRVVFQDAEENPGTSPRPESGGEVLVREGVCKGVSSAYALHIWSHPGSESGVFLSRPGAMMGNSGRIYFRVKSSGGHVASPNTGVNSLRVCNEIMNRLSSFGARHFSPTEPMTLEPAVLNAGKGTNVTPGEAEMWYGFRTMLPRGEHVKMAEAVLHEVMGVAHNMKAQITDVELIHGHPALINDRATHDGVANLLVASGEKVVKMEPLLGGEDFSHIAMTVPSAMFMLCAHTEGTGDHHSPTFCPDESQFWRGVKFWLLLATN